ncbi:MAG: hypothetical protein WKG07_06275 [Hymenobacter sp.]
MLLVLGILTGLALPARAQTGGAGQTVPVAISWTIYASLRSPSASPDTPPRRVPSFVGASHGAGELLGTYTLRVPGTVASGELRDAVYEPFPAADAALLGSTALPPRRPRRCASAPRRAGRTPTCC